MMLMRGAAALASLSLEHINPVFDWMEEENSNSPKANSLLTITTSVLDRPKVPSAFNGLRSLVHDKA